MTPEQLQKENELLKRKLAYFEKDAASRGFFSLNRIVNQQIDRLNSFDLDTEIKQDPKTDKVYDRTQAIWEKLPKLISELNSLRFELKIDEGEEEKEKLIPISAKAIANGEI
jgi:hypothetical protein